MKNFLLELLNAVYNRNDHYELLRGEPDPSNDQLKRHRRVDHDQWKCPQVDEAAFRSIFNFVIQISVQSSLERTTKLHRALSSTVCSLQVYEWVSKIKL